MLEAARAARGDHRYADRFRDGARQLEVVARLCAVAVHARQQDLACAELFGLLRPFERVDARIHAAAVQVQRPAAARAALCVHRDDDALASEFVCGLFDDPRVLQRRRVDRDLIRAGAQDRREILHGADAAADRKRDENAVRNARHDVDHDIARVGGSRDVEQHELVRILAVVLDRRFDGVARVAQIDKIRPLDDPAVFQVETGNNPFCIHQSRPPSPAIAAKLRSSSMPTAPLFSGWNWQARRLSFCTAASIVTPYDAVAVTMSSSAFR